MKNSNSCGLQVTSREEGSDRSNMKIDDFVDWALVLQISAGKGKISLWSSLFMSESDDQIILFLLFRPVNPPPPLLSSSCIRGGKTSKVTRVYRPHFSLSSLERPIYIYMLVLISSCMRETLSATSISIRIDNDCRKEIPERIEMMNNTYHMSIYYMMMMSWFALASHHEMANDSLHGNEWNSIGACIQLWIIFHLLPCWLSK